MSNHPLDMSLSKQQLIHLGMIAEESPLIDTQSTLACRSPRLVGPFLPQCNPEPKAVCFRDTVFSAKMDILGELYQMEYCDRMEYCDSAGLIDQCLRLKYAVHSNRPAERQKYKYALLCAMHDLCEKGALIYTSAGEVMLVHAWRQKPFYFRLAFTPKSFWKECCSALCATLERWREKLRRRMGA